MARKISGEIRVEIGDRMRPYSKGPKERVAWEREQRDREQRPEQDSAGDCVSLCAAQGAWWLSLSLSRGREEMVLIFSFLYTLSGFYFLHNICNDIKHPYLID